MICGERGLTLIELLVALAVAAIVLMTVQGVFLAASELRATQRDESAHYHRSRVFIDRLARELGSSLYRSDHPYARFSVEDGDEPLLELSTFASSPASGGTPKGAAMVRYRWQRAAQGEGLELWRHERPLQSDSWRGDGQRLFGAIGELKLRCYDGERWQEKWDSTTSTRLPQLLEISYELGETGEGIPFRTVLEVGGGSGS